MLQIVMIPGLMNDGWVWRHQIGPLSRFAPVVIACNDGAESGRDGRAHPGDRRRADRAGRSFDGRTDRAGGGAAGAGTDRGAGAARHRHPRRPRSRTRGARGAGRAGAEDGWSPPAQHEAIPAAILGAVLRIVPGAGHMLPVEDPDATTALLVEWARRVVAA